MAVTSKAKPSLTQRQCEQCKGNIAMMCQVGTLFCSRSCEQTHLTQWAKQAAKKKNR